MSRGKAGFTLVELVVALAVTGLVLAAAQAALAAIGDAWARTGPSQPSVFAAAGARRALAHWLRGGVFWFEGASALGSREEVGLTIVVADGGPLDPGPHRVRLWVASGPGSVRRGLVAELTPVPADRRAGADTVPLAPDATGFSLRYCVSVDGRDAWVNEWRTEMGLPRAIELRIAGAPPEAALPSSLGLPIVVPVAISR